MSNFGRFVRSLGRFDGSDYGDVASLRVREPKALATAGSIVVFDESRAKAARLDPHDRIDPRVVILAAIKDLAPDYVLLDAVRASIKRTFNGKAQEATHPLGAGKELA